MITLEGADYRPTGNPAIYGGEYYSDGTTMIVVWKGMVLNKDGRFELPEFSRDPLYYVDERHYDLSGYDHLDGYALD